MSIFIGKNSLASLYDMQTAGATAGVTGFAGGVIGSVLKSEYRRWRNKQQKENSNKKKREPEKPFLPAHKADDSDTEKVVREMRDYIDGRPLLSDTVRYVYGERAHLTNDQYKMMHKDFDGLLPARITKKLCEKLRKKKHHIYEAEKIIREISDGEAKQALHEAIRAIEKDESRENIATFVTHIKKAAEILEADKPQDNGLLAKLYDTAATIYKIHGSPPSPTGKTEDNRKEAVLNGEYFTDITTKLSHETRKVMHNLSGQTAKSVIAKTLEAFEKGECRGHLPVLINGLKRTAEILEAETPQDNDALAKIYGLIAEKYENDASRQIVKSQSEQTPVKPALNLSGAGLRAEDYEKEYADALNELANAFRDKGDYDKALTEYRKALEIRRKLLGPRHSDVATSRDHIASTQAKKGDDDRSLRGYRKALEIMRSALGDNRPNTAIIYSRIGLIYCRKGECGKALKAHQKARKVICKTLDENHPYVAEIYNNIGFTYNKAGQYDAALEYYNKALNIIRRKPNAERAGDADSYDGIGSAYYGKRDYDKALQHHEKALNITRKQSGENHPNMAGIYRNIGLCLEKKGDYEQAAESRNEALAVLRKKFGPRHPAIAAIYQDIAACYEENKNPEAALKCYKKASEAAKDMPPTHPTVKMLRDKIERLSKGNESPNAIRRG